MTVGQDGVGQDGGAAPRILPCGQRAVLVELGSQHQVHAYASALRANPPSQVREVVPAARTVLVAVQAARDLEDVVPLLRQLPFGEHARHAETEPVTIAVIYDGADLEEVCRLTSLSTQEVIARHTAATYTADFLGFAPGFAYLSGLDARLQVPRRDTPRTDVPAGAVAIAGPYSAVYPRSSPGGWQLIGRTETVLFDPGSDRPALLQAGTRVRFEAVEP